MRLIPLKCFYSIFLKCLPHTVSEHRITGRQITERQIIERRITERQITERQITERQKLLNIEYYQTPNITGRWKSPGKK